MQLSSEPLSECHFPLRVAGPVAPQLCCPFKLLQGMVSSLPANSAGSIHPPRDAICFFFFGQKSGEKGVYTTTVGPVFSRSVARPQGHRAKNAMVYTIFLGKQGKRVYTIGPERRVYTIEPQTRKKKKGKKEGLHSGGVYFFLS